MIVKNKIYNSPNPSLTAKINGENQKQENEPEFNEEQLATGDIPNNFSEKNHDWRPRRTPAYCVTLLKFKRFCFWDFKKYPTKYPLKIEAMKKFLRI